MIHYAQCLRIFMEGLKLFKLIKSLNKAEKRQVRQLAQRYKGQKNSKYIVLFNLMEEIDEYDDTKVQYALKRKGFTKHIARSQTYLYDLILNCLSGKEDSVRAYASKYSVY